MAHLHEVRDSDTHFIIDPITRVITNTAAAKNRLMQGDHNSEIFTFEIPKTVEFHDMNLCNKVEIHYINVAADKTGTSVDVYDVQDFGAAEDDINAYAFSWRISDNATKYAGTLNFRIRFACTDEAGNYNYRWHTDIFKGITIADGFDNAPAVIADYSDVLEQWKVDLQNSVTPEKIDAAVTKYLDANPIEHPIERIESLDAENLVNFRDLESGNYIIYGYFSPYANSDISISADNSLISVIKKAAGTHVICLDPLNAKIVFFEILVDETAEKGYTYTRTIMPVLEVNALIEKVGNLEELTTNDKANLVTAINEVYNKIPDIKPLTFTGAVEAEYDGSQPLSVEIPEGGGGISNTNYEVLANGTIAQSDAIKGAYIDLGVTFGDIAKYKETIFRFGTPNSGPNLPSGRLIFKTSQNLDSYGYPHITTVIASKSGNIYKLIFQNKSKDVWKTVCSEVTSYDLYDNDYAMSKEGGAFITKNAPLRAVIQDMYTYIAKSPYITDETPITLFVNADATADIRYHIMGVCEE